MTLTWHQNKIDEHAIILIADASIPAYRNGRIGPRYCTSKHWLEISHMKIEKDAMDTLSTEVSRVLISKRDLVKATILTSLGSPPLAGQTSRPGSLDIVELSTLIILKLKGRVKVDLRLCGLAHGLLTAWIKQPILDPDLVRYKHVELKDLASGSGVPARVAGTSNWKYWQLCASASSLTQFGAHQFQGFIPFSSHGGSPDRHFVAETGGREAA
ncbi:hypothetical protein B0H19DRAFT_1080957 [Mycena capillaripes]|nr:hypothetical protein B0H19DRAFT_1080957 [Mycena capillaripes]